MLPATSCYRFLRCCLAVFSFGGASASISVRRLLSSCSFSPSCWLPESSAPPSGFRCFLPEGRGFYRFAALPVNHCFVDSLDSSALSFRASSSGARLLPPPRLLSTRCVDRRIPRCRTDSLEVPSAPVRGLLREGRGFYHCRASCQPPERPAPENRPTPQFHRPLEMAPTHLPPARWSTSLRSTASNPTLRIHWSERARFAVLFRRRSENQGTRATDSAPNQERTRRWPPCSRAPL
ncbi:hypothetical protein MYMAC_004599 [Corallococcus macrosporus DSM 14697]|uniref:Secreted protein n=1 Tax=Corallococcus macrosporus DSM 14697 TaxID=1189310 RepID=A0A250JZR5_9BACT|nr:hypothetical protein MYMAC_004599 [Corallococcus macrosporus DSM 14697]